MIIILKRVSILFAVILFSSICNAEVPALPKAYSLPEENKILTDAYKVFGEGSVISRVILEDLKEGGQIELYCIQRKDRTVFVSSNISIKSDLSITMADREAFDLIVNDLYLRRAGDLCDELPNCSRRLVSRNRHKINLYFSIESNIKKKGRMHEMPLWWFDNGDHLYLGDVSACL